MTGLQDWNWLVPQALVVWAAEWGYFFIFLTLVLFIFYLGLRKVFLWRRGTTEVLVYLKRLTELQEKSLLELELLNKALRAPLKKAAAQSEVKKEEPREVPLKERESFLAALRAARLKPELEEK